MVLLVSFIVISGVVRADGGGLVEVSVLDPSPFTVLFDVDGDGVVELVADKYIVDFPGVYDNYLGSNIVDAVVVDWDGDGGGELVVYRSDGFIDVYDPGGVRSERVFVGDGCGDGLVVVGGCVMCGARVYCEGFNASVPVPGGFPVVSSGEGLVYVYGGMGVVHVWIGGRVFNVSSVLRDILAVGVIEGDVLVVAGTSSHGNLVLEYIRLDDLVGGGRIVVERAAYAVRPVDAVYSGHGVFMVSSKGFLHAVDAARRERRVIARGDVVALKPWHAVLWTPGGGGLMVVRPDGETWSIPVDHARVSGRVRDVAWRGGFIAVSTTTHVYLYAWTPGLTIHYPGVVRAGERFDVDVDAPRGASVIVVDPYNVSHPDGRGIIIRDPGDYNLTVIVSRGGTVSYDYVPIHVEPRLLRVAVSVEMVDPPPGGRVDAVLVFEDAYEETPVHDRVECNVTLEGASPQHVTLDPHDARRITIPLRIPVDTPENPEVRVACTGKVYGEAHTLTTIHVESVAPRLNVTHGPGNETVTILPAIRGETAPGLLIVDGETVTPPYVARKPPREVTYTPPPGKPLLPATWTFTYTGKQPRNTGHYATILVVEKTPENAIKKITITFTNTTTVTETRRGKGGLPVSMPLAFIAGAATVYVLLALARHGALPTPGGRGSGEDLGVDVEEI